VDVLVHTTLEPMLVLVGVSGEDMGLKGGEQPVEGLAVIDRFRHAGVRLAAALRVRARDWNVEADHHGAPERHERQVGG
jgi:hypothetical protein